MDTSIYIFNLLHYHLMQADWFRLVTNIFYLPAYIITYFFNQFEITNFIVKFVGFSLLSKHLMSLGVCYLLLRRIHRLDIFTYPVLCLAVSTTQSIPWLSAQVHELSVFYWPLIILLLFYEINKKTFITSIFLIAALGLTHESAILGLIFIGFICIHQYKKSKSENRKYYINLGTLAFVATIGCVLRAKFGDYPTTYEYRNLINNPTVLLNDKFLVWQIAMLFCFIFSAFINWHNIIHLSLFFTITIMLFYKIGLPTTDFAQIQQSRFSSLILFYFIAAIHLIHYQYKKVSVKKIGLIITVFALMSSVYREFDLTHRWQLFFTGYKDFIRTSQKKCINSKDENILPAELGTSLHPFYFASILANENKSIRTIHVYYKNNNRFCDTLSDDKKLILGGSNPKYDHYIHLDDARGYFDFSPLLRNE